MKVEAPLVFNTYKSFSGYLEGNRPRNACVYVGAESYEWSREVKGFDKVYGTEATLPIILPSIYFQKRLPRNIPAFASRLVSFQMMPLNSRQFRFVEECLCLGGLLIIGMKTDSFEDDPFEHGQKACLELIATRLVSGEGRPSFFESDETRVCVAKKRDIQQRHFFEDIQKSTKWTHLGLEGADKIFPSYFHKPTPRTVPFRDRLRKALSSTRDFSRFEEDHLSRYRGSYMGSFTFDGDMLEKESFPFPSYDIRFTPGFGESHHGLDMHLIDPSTRELLYRVAIVYRKATGSLFVTEMYPEGGREAQFRKFSEKYSLHPGNFLLILLAEVARLRGFTTFGGIRFMDQLSGNVAGEYEGRFRQVGLKYCGHKIYERALRSEWDPWKGCARSQNLHEARRDIGPLARDISDWFKESGW